MVKRNYRQDKRDWIEWKGQKAQEAAIKNELTGALSGRQVPIKGKDGRRLTTAEEQDR